LHVVCVCIYLYGCLDIVPLKTGINMSRAMSDHCESTNLNSSPLVIAVHLCDQEYMNSVETRSQQSKLHVAAPGSLVQK